MFQYLWIYYSNAYLWYVYIFLSSSFKQDVLCEIFYVITQVRSRSGLFSEVR